MPPSASTGTTSYNRRLRTPPTSNAGDLPAPVGPEDDRCAKPAGLTRVITAPVMRLSPSPTAEESLTSQNGACEALPA